MRNLVLCSLLLPVAFSCIGGGDDKGGSGDADTDTDSDTDVDNTSCGNYAGVNRVGTEWRYAYDDGEISTGESISEITAWDPTTGELTIRTYTEYSNIYWQYISDGYYNYQCGPDGMAAVSYSTTYDQLLEDTTVSGDITVTYDEPSLVLPRALKVGDRWTDTVSGTTEDSQYGTSTFDYDIDYAVTFDEDITVEAGDYSTIVLETTAVGLTTQAWLAEGVGTVQTSNLELVAYAE